MGVFIPEKCRVGWQNRTDTYTKKLAYIIYYDEKGKIRKETSWEGWRDKSIEPQDIDNVPFDGFLLNKGIQRCNYGHFSSGRSLVRIFDPRLGGIEFEVSIDNLLYILMHDDCTKRELIGKYVYAWDGKDLVLLPVSSDDYIAATENTRLRKSKVSSKTLVAGHTYLNKAGDSMVYIGKYLWYGDSNSWSYSYKTKDYSAAKLEHVFAYRGNPKYSNRCNTLNNGIKYFHDNSMSQVADLVSDSIAEDLPELTQAFFHSLFACKKIVRVIENKYDSDTLANLPTTIATNDKHEQTWMAPRGFMTSNSVEVLQKVGDGWLKTSVTPSYEHNYTTQTYILKHFSVYISCTYMIQNGYVKVQDGKYPWPRSSYSYGRGSETTDSQYTNASKESLCDKELFYVDLELENGRIVSLEDYLRNNDYVKSK